MTLDADVDLPRELTCGICLGLVQDAMQTPCCGARWCRDCVFASIIPDEQPGGGSQTKCPKCRHPLVGEDVVLDTRARLDAEKWKASRWAPSSSDLANPASWMCILCNNLLQDAMQLTCCGQWLCNACAMSTITLQRDANSNCPSCKAIISKEEIVRDTYANLCVKALKLPCPSKGCSFVGDFGDRCRHLEECSFRPIEDVLKELQRVEQAKLDSIHSEAQLKNAFSDAVYSGEDVLKRFCEKYYGIRGVTALNPRERYWRLPIEGHRHSDAYLSVTEVTPRLHSLRLSVTCLCFAENVGVAVTVLQPGLPQWSTTKFFPPSNFRWSDVLPTHGTVASQLGTLAIQRKIFLAVNECNDTAESTARRPRLEHSVEKEPRSGTRPPRAPDLDARSRDLVMAKIRATRAETQKIKETTNQLSAALFKKVFAADDYVAAFCHTVHGCNNAVLCARSDRAWKIPIVGHLGSFVVLEQLSPERCMVELLPECDCLAGKEISFAPVELCNSKSRQVASFPGHSRDKHSTWNTPSSILEDMDRFTVNGRFLLALFIR